jgi:hypothetical protein
MTEVVRMCVGKTDQEVDCELGKWKKMDEAEEIAVAGGGQTVPRT